MAGSTADTRDVVTRYFDQLRAGDPAKLAAYFARDVDWYVPGDESLAPWLGRRQHRDEIERFFQELLGNVEPVHFALDELLVEGEVAIATGEFASRMRRTGKVYRSIFFASFTVRGGAIVRYRLLEDSHGLVVALTA
jgi:uncharacterized protein